MILESMLPDLAGPFDSLTWPVAALRLLSALVLTGIIGWERESRAKAAGLRTHMILGLASCLFTLLAFELIELEVQSSDRLRIDPMRLIEAVTAGVAFLAAGSIIQSGGAVRGLTTGAGMWMSGAIGLACGLGQIALAALAVAIGILVLWMVRLVTH